MQSKTQPPTVKTFQNALDEITTLRVSETQKPAFTNPTPDRSILAENFLSHLDLNHPKIIRLLRDCYPDLNRIHGLLQDAQARLRFLFWMTLNGYRDIMAAHRALLERPSAIQTLGFQKPPTYETLREFVNTRLTPNKRRRLAQIMTRLLAEHIPEIGMTQVQDATPCEARRHDPEIPYNGHYEVKMHKAELRWDITHDALLAGMFYHGTAWEGHFVEPISRQLQELGINTRTLVIDGAYPSFLNLARNHRRGTRPLFKRHKGWRVEPDKALEVMSKRYQSRWRRDWYQPDAEPETTARLLVDHGSKKDIESVGRWVRDTTLNSMTQLDKQLTRYGRSHNEGLNASIKALPWTPSRRGSAAMFRQMDRCILSVMAVQLTRAQNGVRERLCHTTHIV